MISTDEFNFDIPEELIAQKPTDNRSDSRLLVYNRKDDSVTHLYVKDLPDILDENFFLIFNKSRVISSRVKVKRKESGGTGELLVLKIVDPFHIEVLTEKSKKYRNGCKILLPDGNCVTVEKELDNQRRLIYSEDGIFDVKYFDNIGQIPLPPYIRKTPDETDKLRYQTVYSSDYGSSAAPTAGLHFDNELLLNLKDKNIDYSFVTLHVGLGTFQPIYTDNIEEHQIHTEEYDITDETAAIINDAISKGKKIIPVGTTSLRTIESAYSEDRIYPGSKATSLYITPGYNFKVTDGLFTNFHTPRSSLSVLVASLIGIEKLKELYKIAVDERYRFFSYGDAMLIL